MCSTLTFESLINVLGLAILTKRNVFAKTFRHFDPPNLVAPVVGLTPGGLSGKDRVYAFKSALADRESALVLFYQHEKCCHVGIITLLLSGNPSMLSLGVIYYGISVHQGGR